MHAISPQTTGSRRIAVFGLGYVGCVTAGCLARLGHRAIGIDRDEYKTRAVPFYEPGLAEVVAEMVRADKLSATMSVAEALDQADLAMICVGTPSLPNGDLNLEQLRRVSVEIGTALSGLPNRRSHPLPVAVRSTVFPGTCRDVVAPALAGMGSVVAHPEFLREGNAVRDFMEPPLLVVGGDDERAVTEVAGIYAALDVQPCLVSLPAAELIKYACNLFHAVKIGFANEIGTLCGGLGIAADQVMGTVCRDVTLNISSAYLKPGFAFGGSCLPKDLRALAYRSARLDLKLPLVEAVLPSNESHLKRAIQAVMDLRAERLGVFGLAFKENTDDLRESPVVALLEHLIGKGRTVRVFDPHIRLDRIYGSNKRFVMTALPHIGKLLDAELRQMLSWAQHLIVAQTPAANFRELICDSGLPVLDLTVMETTKTQWSSVDGSC